ncbi:NAD(P)/FAD-dependent oxidoreductase [Alkalihalophilus lindianensis]|uniref:NAD(P)/FAD-dependent oxidoreductase n=1 Tax=Alkalihalophilus lindianensis TaxID=1630542 RepID=A0ABU3X810_9BACI|nr:NAD(P)/FAD-dependent oxidoreductase [Alkalihalophilus lindianensis]MDV2684027.1 NAD(P)/FAD-dependent oxidoreductase [Alkalihalophilus lindianensis]
MRILDVVVIGAGQAGLSLGYYLKRNKKKFILLDKHRNVGDSWKRRYDSLTLFTPRRYSSLPGLSLEGSQDGYPSKDEVAAYLKEYAKKFEIPIQLDTTVTLVSKEAENLYKVKTDNGEFITRNIVVATGPFQEPFTPTFSKSFSDGVNQLHSDEYRNKSQLVNGTTLIVGAGNSGYQIATELCDDFNIYLAEGNKNKNLPHKILNKSIFWWFDVLGLSKVTERHPVGKILKKNDPVIGKEHKPYIKAGKIKMKKRLKSGSHNVAIFEDGDNLPVNNIIWATGFVYSYPWLEVRGVIDSKGIPIQKRGVTKQKGFYFLGLPWMHTRGSALLTGVNKDAEYLSTIMG